jgi:1,4-alpha-glucan branching enzyme
MSIGYLALVLHAHLPFVRHPESDYVLEEEWLFEAITETYIPLLQMFEGFKRDRFQDHHELDAAAHINAARSAVAAPI